MLIAPSLIAADFGSLKTELAAVEAAGADLLHVDVMDGHFVPNLTFGPFVVATVKKLTRLPLDVHLMISEPRRYARAFAEAGAAHITFHLEAEEDIAATIQEIHAAGCSVGLSIKPGTPFSAVAPFLDQVERFLVMTVEPGFGGQKFMPEMLEKVREAVAWRGQRQLKFDLEVDGGLDEQTIGPSVQAGAEVIVAGTAVFGQPDRAEAIRRLRAAAT